MLDKLFKKVRHAQPKSIFYIQVDSIKPDGKFSYSMAKKGDEIILTAAIARAMADDPEFRNLILCALTALSDVTEKSLFDIIYKYAHHAKQK